MNAIDTFLLWVFVLCVSIFLVGAGIAIVWIAIEDTALGWAIDEMMEERIERWKHGKVD